MKIEKLMGDKIAGDVNLNDAPWWIRVGTVFGVPTLVLLLVLLGTYRLLSTYGVQIAANTQAIMQEMTKHTIDSASVIETQRMLVIIVRANCYNNAKDEDGRRRCMQ